MCSYTIEVHTHLYLFSLFAIILFADNHNCRFGGYGVNLYLLQINHFKQKCKVLFLLIFNNVPSVKVFKMMTYCVQKTKLNVVQKPQSQFKFYCL